MPASRILGSSAAVILRNSIVAEMDVGAQMEQHQHDDLRADAVLDWPAVDIFRRDRSLAPPTCRVSGAGGRVFPTADDGIAAQRFAGS